MSFTPDLNGVQMYRIASAGDIAPYVNRFDAALSIVFKAGSSSLTLYVLECEQSWRRLLGVSMFCQPVHYPVLH
jgi:hypothetical protein